MVAFVVARNNSAPEIYFTSVSFSCCSPDIFCHYSFILGNVESFFPFNSSSAWVKKMEFDLRRDPVYVTNWFKFLSGVYFSSMFSYACFWVLKLCICFPTLSLLRVFNESVHIAGGDRPMENILLDYDLY